jgi:hypothetical protein
MLTVLEWFERRSRIAVAMIGIAEDRTPFAVALVGSQNTFSSPQAG